MLFGVVTPTLNAERYLDALCCSVWAQRSESVEIDHVIVDGGSHDRTLEIAARYPSRVVVSADDGGMYDAINKGLAVVRGDVVGYINSDDMIVDAALERVAKTFLEHPEVQWVCGAEEDIDATGNVLATIVPVHMSLAAYVGLGWSTIFQPTVWIRRSFFERVGPFDITFRNCADYEWYARAMRAEPPFILRDVLARFRIHDGQLSRNAEVMRRESRLVQERHGGRSLAALMSGRALSLRLNIRNPTWFLGKKTGRIRG